MASSTIDELQINIVGSTMRAQDSIDELCKSLTRLKRSLKGLNSREVNITANATQNVTRNVRKLGGASNATTQMLNNLTGAFHKNRKAGSSLLSVVGKLYATFWMLRKAFGWISSSIQFASDLTEVQNVVRNAFGPESEKMINDFAGSLSILNFGMSELTTKQIASKFQAMGVALGVTNKQAEQTQKTIGELPEMYDSAADSMADVSLNLTKLAADMGSFYNQDPTQVAKSLEAVFTGQTRPLTKSLAA